ncbi:MAG: UDP-3-O-(3-hydroxymyristoyl)glucosamine N-acyltransferase [Acidobacteria bacterium]|nr:UDP-3-O-(3-hydroxymyristoyl)glucosamine N-acyltransferase [Acidobacteriota bacterium]
MTLQQLAERIGARLEGDGTLDVARVAALDAAGPGDVTFLANEKYAAEVAATKATAVILGPKGPAAPCAVLRVDNPYLAFAHAARALAPPSVLPVGVHPSAVIGEGVVLGEGVGIGPLAVIGRGVQLGARTVVEAHAVIGAETVLGTDCVIHAHVSIRERCRLGHRVVVQNGAVIGADGFGFAHHADGTHEKIPQTAPVVIEDDVEIGANTTIDRPAVGETRIKAGTKIDNLVQIAHGVVLGRRVLLASQVGISGSTTVGDGVVLAGQVGVAGHITIGDRVTATGQTGITNSVEPGRFISGLPAIDNRDWRKAAVLVGRLPEYRRHLLDLERRLQALETAVSGAAGAPGTPVP